MIHQEKTHQPKVGRILVVKYTFSGDDLQDGDLWNLSANDVEFEIDQQAIPAGKKAEGTYTLSWSSKEPLSDNDDSTLVIELRKMKGTNADPSHPISVLKVPIKGGKSLSTSDIPKPSSSTPIAQPFKVQIVDDEKDPFSLKNILDSTTLAGVLFSIIALGVTGFIVLLVLWSGKHAMTGMSMDMSATTSEHVSPPTDGSSSVTTEYKRTVRSDDPEVLKAAVTNSASIIHEQSTNPPSTSSEKTP